MHGWSSESFQSVIPTTAPSISLDNFLEMQILRSPPPLRQASTLPLPRPIDFIDPPGVSNGKY